MIAATFPPKVSVIIPAYNCAQTLEACLEAVLSSDYPDFEVIVINDGSRDETGIIAERFTGVTTVHKENGGSASAKNHGAANAKGEYFYFLDSDVVIFPDTISMLVKTAISYHVDMVVGRYSTVPANTGFIHHYKAVADYVLYIPKKNRHEVKLDCQIGGGGELISRRAFIALHGFSEQYRGASVEREELLVRFYSHGFHSAADPFIRTRHYFPDFSTLVRNYVFRIHETMKLLHRHRIKFSYISVEKAVVAPAVTFLFFALLLLHTVTGAVQSYLLAGAMILMIYLHREMLLEVVKRKGLIMGVRMFLLHLLLSMVIFLSGVTSYGLIRFSRTPKDGIDV